jgi:hypothetical protein
VTDLLRIFGCAAVALAIVAGVVLAGGDRSTFVPPPEAVAEEFGRRLATRRYELALDDVEAASGISLTTVRLGGESLHARAGAIDQVTGEAGAMKGDRASASVRFHTARAGALYHRFELVRRAGLWKIDGWSDR